MATLISTDFDLTKQSQKVHQPTASQPASLLGLPDSVIKKIFTYALNPEWTCMVHVSLADEHNETPPAQAPHNTTQAFSWSIKTRRMTRDPDNLDGTFDHAEGTRIPLRRSARFRRVSAEEADSIANNTTQTEASTPCPQFKDEQNEGIMSLEDDILSRVSGGDVQDNKTSTFQTLATKNQASPKSFEDSTAALMTGGEGSQDGTLTRPRNRRGKAAPTATRARSRVTRAGRQRRGRAEGTEYSITRAMPIRSTRGSRRGRGSRGRRRSHAGFQSYCSSDTETASLSKVSYNSIDDNDVTTDFAQMPEQRMTPAEPSIDLATPDARAHTIPSRSQSVTLHQRDELRTLPLKLVLNRCQCISDMHDYHEMCLKPSTSQSMTIFNLDLLGLNKRLHALLTSVLFELHTFSFTHPLALSTFIEKILTYPQVRSLRKIHILTPIDSETWGGWAGLDGSLQKRLNSETGLQLCVSLTGLDDVFPTEDEGDDQAGKGKWEIRVSEQGTWVLPIFIKDNSPDMHHHTTHGDYQCPRPPQTELNVPSTAALHHPSRPHSLTSPNIVFYSRAVSLQALEGLYKLGSVDAIRQADVRVVFRRLDYNAVSGTFNIKDGGSRNDQKEQGRKPAMSTSLWDILNQVPASTAKTSYLRAAVQHTVGAQTPQPVLTAAKERLRIRRLKERAEWCKAFEAKVAGAIVGQHELDSIVGTDARKDIIVLE